MHVCTYMYPQWKQLHLLCLWSGNWPARVLFSDLCFAYETVVRRVLEHFRVIKLVNTSLRRTNCDAFHVCEFYYNLWNCLMLYLDRVILTPVPGVA
jgi:hypothetical protein